jgi:radical SAM superfamily enzyme YgiQ (UPF0313 family)
MKILLVACPILAHNRPPISLAYLKSSVPKNKRINLKCLDLNLDFFEKIKFFEKSFSNATMKTKSLIHYKGIRPIIPLDTTIKKYFIESWSELIKNYNPNILCISIYDSTRNFSTSLAKKIKEWNKNIIILFGGPDCMLNGKKYVLNGNADIVVVGEGEKTFPKLLRTIQNKSNLDSVKGIIYSKSGKIIETKGREEISNLDPIKFPDYSDFNISKYKYYNKVTLPILGSRGCINRCKFCNHTYFWKRYRFRSADNIFKEVKNNIKKYNVTNFVFHDSYFAANLFETKKLLNLIIKNHLNINWEATMGFNKKMNHNLFQKMENAGCIRLNFGLESGSQSVIDDMGKNFELKDAERIIEYCNKCGIKINLYIIVGYPTETKKDFFETIKFVKKHRHLIEGVTIGKGCSILPGSYLSDNINKYKIKYVNFVDWSNEIVTPKIKSTRVKTLKKLVEKMGLRCFY